MVIVLELFNLFIKGDVWLANTNREYTNQHFITKLFPGENGPLLQYCMLGYVLMDTAEDSSKLLKCVMIYSRC